MSKLNLKQINLLQKYHLNLQSPNFLEDLDKIIDSLEKRIQMLQNKNTFKVLTDIQGEEDRYGDMDFKVAGTENGVTAVQLDNKAYGLSPEILKQALQQAYKARVYILEIMKQTINQPSIDISQYAPRVLFIQVPLEKIGEVIGTGGKIIKALEKDYNVQVDLNNDTGKCFIYSKDLELAEKCLKKIKQLIRDYKVGEVIKGKVYRLESYGGFVKILDEQNQETDKEGMIHISNLANYRVAKVEDILKIGQIIQAKILEINDRGQINLSLK